MTPAHATHCGVQQCEIFARRQACNFAGSAGNTSACSAWWQVLGSCGHSQQELTMYFDHHHLHGALGYGRCRS
jgi:hypothetical protein